MSSKKSIFKFGDKFGVESPLGDWIGKMKDNERSRLLQRDAGNISHKLTPNQLNHLKGVFSNNGYLKIINALLSQKNIYNIVISPPFAPNIDLAFSTGDFAMTSVYYSSLAAEKISELYFDGMKSKLGYSTSDDVDIRTLKLLHNILEPKNRPAIMHNLIVDRPSDAYEKMKEIVDSGHIINNLIIDSHGTGEESSFAIGGGGF